MLWPPILSDIPRIRATARFQPSLSLFCVGTHRYLSTIPPTAERSCTPRTCGAINLHFTGDFWTLEQSPVHRSLNTNSDKPPLSRPAFSTYSCPWSGCLRRNRALRMCAIADPLREYRQCPLTSSGEATKIPTSIPNRITERAQDGSETLHSPPTPMDVLGLPIVRFLLFRQFLSVLKLLLPPRSTGARSTYPRRSLTKSLIISTLIRAVSGIAPWSANLGPPVAGEISSIV